MATNPLRTPGHFLASEEPRDYLLEAVRIICGKTRMLPEISHLRAIWLATDEEMAEAHKKIEALEP